MAKQICLCFLLKLVRSSYSPDPLEQSVVLAEWKSCYEIRETLQLQYPTIAAVTVKFLFLPGRAYRESI